MGFFYFGGRIKVNVYKQFEISVYRTMRGRGALICETDKGVKLLRETSCREEKYAKEDYITSGLKKNGMVYIDTFVRNTDGNIIAEDDDKKRYYLKDWFEAAELDVRSYQMVMGACRAIAGAHNVLNRIELPEDIGFNINSAQNEEEKFKKKIKEMKTVRNYLKRKKGKSDFERMAYEQIGKYIGEGERTLCCMEDIGYTAIHNRACEKKTMIHGSCNHHNILGTRGYVTLVNYERAQISLQISDLYNFMRKMLEKYNWDIKLAYKMIDEYNREKTIGEDDIKALYCMFSFPEKFFKIMNHYYNSSKAWMADKDIEKLYNVINQNEARLRFVESLK